MPLSPGTRLAHYDVTSLLGEGGMGEVYQARDTTLDRDVALKVLPEAFTSDPDRLARFEREAKVLASLNHPNIGSIYGLEEAEGVRALVLELVEGPTLADRIKPGPIPLDEALPIAKQIAEALEAAHEQGVIHRDLKPANVKVKEDERWQQRQQRGPPRDGHARRADADLRPRLWRGRPGALGRPPRGGSHAGSLGREWVWSHAFSERRLARLSSTQSGQVEVYAQPYPGPGPTVPVSIGGGVNPVWSADGSELFYTGVPVPGPMMAVTVTIDGDQARASTPSELFQTGNYLTNQRHAFHLGLDGRFLMQRFESGSPSDPKRERP